MFVALDLQLLTFSQGLEDGLFARYHSRATMKYANELACYTSIMAPVARSIKALEGRAANAADVYIFWLAIAASLRDLFSRDRDIDEELAEKVTAIVNRRYKEFIDNSPTDVYFAAFFLDPRKSQCVMGNHANLARQVTTSLIFSSGHLQQAPRWWYLLSALGQTKYHTLPPLSVPKNSSKTCCTGWRRPKTSLSFKWDHTLLSKGWFAN